MPIYEYQCNQCNQVFEIFHKIDEDCKVTCPKCLGPAKRLISATNFVPERVGFLCERLSLKKSKGSEEGRERRNRKRAKWKR